MAAVSRVSVACRIARVTVARVGRVALQHSRTLVVAPAHRPSLAARPQQWQRSHAPLFAVCWRADMSTEVVDRRLRDLGEKFGEARMEIEDAADSRGTVYFDDDASDAKMLVDEVLNEYAEILECCSSDEERNGVRQSWGLRLEQLKGELQQLHDDDH
eukprot:m.64397 g.64397  ORF g.64397 m.64397 type:complete len:158 (-) comp13582_c0_seq2:420-893(-)